MPRRSRPQPVVIPTTSLVASAMRYPGKAPRLYVPKQPWQAECYRHYAICGEARFAATFFGHALSRAVLSIAEPGVEGPKTVDTGPAADALAALFNGADGQSQMLQSIGTHLTIAGECYLVGRTVEDTDVWEIVSCMEMRVNGNNWSVHYGDALPDVPLTEQDVVIRIWQPNPARRVEADSPFRSLLPILSEIEWLTKHVFAQTASRLAGAGILLMPESMTFPPPPGQEGAETAAMNEADSFMLTLAEAMMTPLSDPGSPSAVVPIVVTAPDEAIASARLLTFWSELDAASMSLRGEAIRRFALGMDLPPEQILGMSSNGGTGGGTSNGVSHWGAWQIEESTIKMHVEPMLELVANAVTVGYIRHAAPPGPQYVTYSTEALRLRPDRSREAFELYDRGVIGPRALVRENGFSLDDMPDPIAYHLWLLQKVATQAAATPEQMDAALAQLGVDLGVPAQPGPTPRKPLPPPATGEQTRPRTPAEHTLLHTCEALVFRALERAGNRLRQNVSKPPGVPAYQTHEYIRANGNTATLLVDAWSCAPQVLADLADPDAVVPVLNS
jgi:hypothetical protein